ncbi:MAG: hypothetical protein GY830_06310 [Bacteroidetes bacterium]|nr:hypothetical protein [Bacteroidota bacterium]
MKKITLNIPEDKYSFFLELIKNLPFIRFEQDMIPESHKSMVRERIKKSNPKDLIDWDQASINFD